MGKNRDGYKEVWTPVYDNFEQHYPELSDRMVDWYPSGQMEITVKLDDGSILKYDWMGATIEHIRVPNDFINDYDEAYCKERFGYNLRNKMRHMGISQDELSYLTDISKVSLSKYMNGKASPTVYNLLRIAKALRCSVSELTNIR